MFTPVGTFLLGSGFLSDEMITNTTTASYGPIEAKYDYSQHIDHQQPVSLSAASESPMFSSGSSTLASPSSSASSNLQLSMDSSSTLHFSSPKIEDEMDTSSPSLSPPCAQPQTNIKKPNHGGRKRSIIFEQAEAEIQRKEFLERNRIAASKCRQKKKKWVKDLETNYEKLSTQNQHLRSMFLLYQDEINSLKTELLSRNGLCSCADMWR
ncbi:hypothetical protein BCR42DRAFT_72747 [Absidia repens]|uniref:BZIP domain-containing protein n=1 Tax=Absidia repens TaxID=90262 RepID=A0A1X2IB94_9FUNG|nr:hypothetical protein BCR42DRAFT_72747 [Absidia repens]